MLAGRLQSPATAQASLSDDRAVWYAGHPWFLARCVSPCFSRLLQVVIPNELRSEGSRDGDTRTSGPRSLGAKPRRDDSPKRCRTKKRSNAIRPVLRKRVQRWGAFLILTPSRAS